MDADDDLDLSRRDFMLAGTTSFLALSSTSGQVGAQQVQSAEQFEFQGVADLMGPEDARPEPDDPFFDNKVFYAYRYEATDTGIRWFITQDDSDWSELNVIPQNQIDEVRVTEYESFFNHTFARPESPDDKNWDYTPADITKDGSELELAATTALVSQQRGNYPPGSESIPGVAARLTGTPTSGECFYGYFLDTDDDNVPDDGFGFGMDTTGTFTFVAKDGSLRRVYQDNWNGPDSVADDPFLLHYPRICRFPHLFYGGGSIAYRIVDHNDDPETELKTVHIETPDTAAESGSPFDDGPPISQPNLPVAFMTNGLTGGSLRANAAHYEIGQKQGETRVNGEHFMGVTVGTTGWTPLVSWRKRSGWDMVNVKPLRVSAFAKTNDVMLELQLNPTLTGASFSLPTNTSSDETSVQVDTSGAIDTNGERRWVGTAPAGQGNQSGDLEAEDLQFNLPADQIITLAAQADGGEATVSGNVNWQEFF